MYLFHQLGVVVLFNEMVNVCVVEAGQRKMEGAAEAIRRFSADNVI